MDEKQVEKLKNGKIKIILKDRTSMCRSLKGRTNLKRVKRLDVRRSSHLRLYRYNLRHSSMPSTYIHYIPEFIQTN